MHALLNCFKQLPAQVTSHHGHQKALRWHFIPSQNHGLAIECWFLLCRPCMGLPIRADPRVARRPLEGEAIVGKVG
eukprot:5390835-Amphidinium_carterae.1